jgi:hypothetical protein
MIYIRPEGTPTRQGLNLYPWSDSHSRGGLLRVGNWIVRLRWSLTAHRWFGGVERIDPVLEQEIMARSKDDKA